MSGPRDAAPRLSRGRFAVFSAAALVLVALIALGALEMVGRLADPLGISYYPETARYMDTLIVEEPIGYRNRPGLTGRFFGAPVTINALGMRDREVSPDPAPGEYRVAVLGDSFPFGIGVSAEDGVVAVAERVLNESAPDGRTFRLLNFGVPSYNTEQELIQFEALSPATRPNAVVLLYALNDIYPKMWVFEKRRGLTARIAQRSYALTFLFAAYRLASAPKGTAAAAELDDYRSDGPRWAAVDRALTALHARCRAAGLPFAVLTYDEMERPPVAMVRGVGVREGFPVLNLVPWTDPRWRGQDPRRYVNSKVDSHPNPEGCRIYGRILAEGMQRLGVVPSE